MPITFVGGYLGTGKTTVINELLAAADRPVAVIVNDVGSVNIDARLIRRATADMIELTDGCICCSSIDGMGAALDAIRGRSLPPDHVVVELSGVADPQRMIPWGKSAGFRLDGVVVVVGADQMTGPPLPDTVAANIRTHIESADLLILTKTDLLDVATATEARTMVATLAPGVPIFESASGRLLPGALGRLLNLGGRRTEGPTATQAPTMFDLHEVSSVPAPVGLSVAELHQWVQDLATVQRSPDGLAPRGQLVRAKGIVATSDVGIVLLQLVGPRIDIEPLPLPEHQPATNRLLHLAFNSDPSVHRSAAPVTDIVLIHLAC